MSSITLLELRTQARQRADMETSQFITDAELTNYINSSIAELHDILVQEYGEEYNVKESPTFTTAGQAEDYSLSTIVGASDDFYKLKGIDAKINGSEWTTLYPFQFAERNKYQTTGAWSYLGMAKIRYRIIGNNLRLTPIPDDGTSIRIWYAPTATKLTLDADTLADINQYSEYVIVDAAIKMLQKEESDTQVLERQKSALKRRIEEAAGNRDAGFGDSVSDVYDNNTEYFFRQNN